MRIAFIGQKGIPTLSGGIERHVEELAIRMARQGHQVFVYARNNYTSKKIKNYKGVQLIHLPSISTKRLDAISHTFLATVHSLFCRYDVIHYHGIGPSSLTFIPKILKWKSAVVATFHCQDYLHQKWSMEARAFLRLGEFIACTVPDATIAVSKALVEYTMKKYKTEPIMIPNGADVYPISETDIIQKWNLKDKKYIFWAGRLVKHKGIHYLIEAFKRLEDTNKLPNNFKLVIAGDGAHTEDYVLYLKAISQGRENIVFTGIQTGDALNQLFSHAYMYVQPSESEGLSVALLEAMQYSLAPLVSDIKENLEAIGNAGYSFENKNVGDLEQKMAYMLNKPEEMAETGARARERSISHFSWNSAVEQTVRLYRDVIQRKLGNKYGSK